MPPMTRPSVGGGRGRRPGRGPASRPCANTSIPRWTVAASSIASRIVSTRPALAPAGHGRAPPADRAPHEVADRARVADRRAVEGDRRRRQVERRDLAHVGQQRRRRELDHRPLDRPVPGGLAQHGLGASANGTSTTASSAAHSSSRVATTYALSGSSEACWSPLIATDAARATTSGHSAATRRRSAGASAA